MAVEDMMDKMCDIYKDESVDQYGEDIRTEVLVYQDVPCAVYNINYAVKNREWSQKTDWSNIEIIIPKDKTDVKQGMLVKVRDKDVGDMWEFFIESPMPQRDKYWNISHIELALSNKVR